MPDPVLRWDSVAGRYRTARGQFVSDLAARAAVDELLTTTAGRLRFQYERLSVFALDLAQGRVSGPQAASRARAYARAAYLTYEGTRREDARRRGAGEEKWTRRASESCEGCKTQSDRGWVSVGTLPPLGSQPCRGNCRCVIQTRRAPGEVAA